MSKVKVSLPLAEWFEWALNELKADEQMNHTNRLYGKNDFADHNPRPRVREVSVDSTKEASVMLVELPKPVSALVSPTSTITTTASSSSGPHKAHGEAERRGRGATPQRWQSSNQKSGPGQVPAPLLNHV